MGLCLITQFCPGCMLVDCPDWHSSSSFSLMGEAADLGNYCQKPGNGNSAALLAPCSRNHLKGCCSMPCIKGTVWGISVFIYEEIGVAFVFLMLSLLPMWRQLQETAVQLAGGGEYPWAGERLGPDLPSLLSAGMRARANQGKKKHQGKRE